MTHSPVGGHLDCFQFLAFINEATLKNSCMSFFGGQGHSHSGVGLLGYRV